MQALIIFYVRDLYSFLSNRYFRHSGDSSCQFSAVLLFRIFNPALTDCGFLIHNSRQHSLSEHKILRRERCAFVVVAVCRIVSIPCYAEFVISTN